MSKQVTIEQVANGFIVREIDVNHHSHVVDLTEPLVFNNIHDMYSWMSEYFKEDNRESHSEK